MIIITDSTADIRGDEVNELNIRVVPLNVTFSDKSYQDSVDLYPDEFYELLKTTKEFPKTSQPSPDLFEKIFNEAKDNNEDAIYLSVSSGLSGTLNSARIAKDLIDYDRIFIVDTLESIQGLRILVKVACKMRDENATALEIVEKIEYLKNHIHINSMIDTLDYLYKGGRLNKAVAIIGNIIKLKPLIDLNPKGEIRMYGTAFGVQRAYAAVLKEIKTTPINYDYPICFGYTNDKEPVQKLIEKVSSIYPIKDYDISQIGPAIGSHIGHGGFCMMYVSDKPRD